jgi:hypothetical protein
LLLAPRRQCGTLDSYVLGHRQRWPNLGSAREQQGAYETTKSLWNLTLFDHWPKVRRLLKTVGRITSMLVLIRVESINGCVNSYLLLRAQQRPPQDRQVHHRDDL